jgi:hypothetical protein
MKFYLYSLIILAMLGFNYLPNTYIDYKNQQDMEKITRSLNLITEIKADVLEILIDHSIEIYNILPDTDIQAKHKILDFCKRKFKLMVQWNPNKWSYEYTGQDWNTFTKALKNKESVIEIIRWGDNKDRIDNLLYYFNDWDFYENIW